MQILIAYDGSENADHAIDVAAGLFPGADAAVVHAWEPASSAAARAAVYLPEIGDSPELLAHQEQQAAQVVQRGAARAAAAGLQVSARTLRANGPLWSAIVDEVADRRPDVTVMGTRGLTGLRGAVAGSVSRAVVSHAHAPVLTVPLEG